MITITQVSRSLGISTRMLRYYEQNGLIQSRRTEGYAYRVYDENAVERLRQILILRKLRIPVKQIQTILQSDNAVAAIGIFRQNIRELDGEIAALSTIRGVLNRFVDELQQTAHVKIHHLVSGDAMLVASIASLSLVTINQREEKTMGKEKELLNNTAVLKDVRIIYLPPSAVAAAHYIGDDPEDHTNDMITRFVRETSLPEIKPDLRHYGFNHPSPVDATGFHGYEMWVTIPEDWVVPAPLEKKHFGGGLYAAHTIMMGEFDDWIKLFAWVDGNDKYEFAGDMLDQEHMCGLMEEHLNYISHIGLATPEPEDMQLDLLMPLRERHVPER